MTPTTKCSLCHREFVGTAEVCLECRHAQCLVCGRKIAAGFSTCARHTYGQLVEHQGEHVRDAVDLMRIHDSTFLSAAGRFALHQ